MSDRLDCLVIGYNDLPFSQNEQRVINRERRDPERRIFMREHILLEGERLPYMEVVNRTLQRAGRTPPDTYLDGGEVPNLAAHYLASYLITRGLSAEPISLFGAERDRIQHLLETRRPRTVAVTTTYYLMPWPVVEINQFIRSHLPETRIVVGGPLVNNLVADLGPDELVEMFTWMGGDIYVKESQGEETLRSIVEAVRSHTDLSAVPNSYVSTTSGDFEYTRTQQEANVMDECATDWDLFTENVGVTVHTRTARSCAYKCSFCDYPVRAGALSLTSVEQVERELRQLDRLGARHVAFMDDTFNIPGPRFKDLCRMMARNDFGFQWYSFFRAAAARDRETYDLMADSGCSAVFLGIESGDDEILRNMAKVATTDRYRFGMEQLHDRGITTFASFISGFPGETEATIQRTIDFINETQPTFYRSEPWWYNHRSPVHLQADRFGITGREYRWTHDTMDINGACDGVDALFDGVTGSLWMPGYNFDFWAIPYLLGKGFTIPDLTEFHRLAQEVMRHNDRPGVDPDPAVVNALHRVFDQVQAVPGRYRRSASTSPDLVAAPDGRG